MLGLVVIWSWPGLMARYPTLRTAFVAGTFGGLGGTLATGRVLDYLDRPERKMCNLYLSMMDKMDVRVDRFGDASQRLAGF